VTELSVVVTVVDGGATLERLLRGLTAQDRPPTREVLVPWDESVSDPAGLAARFPAVRFVPMGAVTTRRPIDSPAGQHELYDRRRAAGLALASGDLVAILEDRGVPRPDWARGVVAAHRELPHAVIGGAIENGRDGRLNWAVYFCDFGRYQLPFEAGPRPYVSDVNICYKRRALEATRELWRERYHETTVHWALLRAGEVLFLSPDFAVDQMRDDLTLRRVLRERVGWGRLFAYTRARDVSTGRRLVLAALSPLLPFVLLLRHLRGRVTRHRGVGTFLAVSPVVFLLLAAWSLGELIGYATGEP
jgi:hypothetical protein